MLNVFALLILYESPPELNLEYYLSAILNMKNRRDAFTVFARVEDSS